MTENHFQSHFSPFHINTQLFFKIHGGNFGWPKITFSPFQINFQMQLSLLLNNMDPGGHFGWLKITFDHISRHFRSIHKFYWKFCHKMAAGGHFRSYLSLFHINKQLFFLIHKMAAGGHFGWPKITLDRISRHFRSIRYFFLVWKFCHKMSAGGHFRWPKINFYLISRHFRSIRYCYFLVWRGIEIQNQIGISFNLPTSLF